MILFGFTDWHIKVIEAVIKEGSYSAAARALGVSYGSVRAVFSKVRTNDRDAFAYHNQVLAYRTKLGPKKRYLTT